MKKEHVLIGAITILLGTVGWWFSRWSDGVDRNLRRLDKNVTSIKTSVARIEAHINRDRNFITKGPKYDR